MNRIKGNTNKKKIELDSYKTSDENDEGDEDNEGNEGNGDDKVIRVIKTIELNQIQLKLKKIGLNQDQINFDNIYNKDDEGNEGEISNNNILNNFSRFQNRRKKKSSKAHNSYLDITAHWINKEFEICNMVLNVEEIPYSHTVLDDWNLEDKIIIIVIDNGSNVKSAVTRLKKNWIPSSAEQATRLLEEENYTTLALTASIIDEVISTRLLEEENYTTLALTASIIDEKFVREVTNFTIDKRIYPDESYLKSAATSCAKLEFHKYFKD
ncbi:hypothetical protein Glove_135g63 [Diversispora epigaea]|uniref:Uncharacterized protein n=1 Tax=Diversispora epigaea TaxID=1348612 RepID=A0A397J1B7_9GLOM|nr:hypothetical protein Glove_135g63 [Diversispora epigaea]